LFWKKTFGTVLYRPDVLFLLPNSVKALVEKNKKEPNTNKMGLVKQQKLCKKIKPKRIDRYGKQEN